MKKVGIVGAGYIAEWHLKGLKKTKNLSVVAVCDINREKAVDLAERFQIDSHYDDFERMLLNEQLDVVHILLPPVVHYKNIKLALNFGVHVFVEKPFCTDFKQCLELIELAKKKKCILAISHNFLFSPIYENLKQDIQQKKTGTPLNFFIHWFKEIFEISTGPHTGWLMEHPGNLILEIGPHSVAHLLDLMGEPEEISVKMLDLAKLSSGGHTYRQWTVTALKKRTYATLNFCLGSSYGGHSIEVLGNFASAKVDFEGNQYHCHQHSRYAIDFNRFAHAMQFGTSVLKQGTAVFFDYILSKIGFNRPGNAFGESITCSIQSFYQNLDGKIDRRHCPHFASRVVYWCEEIAKRCAEDGVSLKPRVAFKKRHSSEILVIGATGFIGKSLIESLLKKERSIRVLCRDPKKIPQKWIEKGVDVVVGDALLEADLKESIRGVHTVYHLAKAKAATWKEFYEREVLSTQKIAEICKKEGGAHLIYSSSIAACYSGRGAQVIKDTTQPPSYFNRFNSYARAKALTEFNLRRLIEEKQYPISIVRPGIVLGSGSSPFHLGVANWKQGSFCELWGNGRNPLPFVLVEDVAEALSQMVGNDQTIGYSFNFIGDVRLSALDYIKELERIMGCQLSAVPTSTSRFYCVAMVKYLVKCLIRHPEKQLPSFRDWDSRGHLADYRCDLSKKLLDWNPCHSTEEFIKKGIEEPANQWLQR